MLCRHNLPPQTRVWIKRVMQYKGKAHPGAIGGMSPDVGIIARLARIPAMRWPA